MVLGSLTSAKRSLIGSLGTVPEAAGGHKDVKNFAKIKSLAVVTAVRRRGPLPALQEGE